MLIEIIKIDLSKIVVYIYIYIFIPEMLYTWISILWKNKRSNNGKYVPLSVRCIDEMLANVIFLVNPTLWNVVERLIYSRIYTNFCHRNLYIACMYICSQLRLLRAWRSLFNEKKRIYIYIYIYIILHIYTLLYICKDFVDPASTRIVNFTM